MARPADYDLACNWKVYVDNYLDGGYHVNTIHPGLAGVLDYKQYRTTCDGNTVCRAARSSRASGETRPHPRRRHRGVLVGLPELHDQPLRRRDGHQPRAAARPWTAAG